MREINLYVSERGLGRWVVEQVCTFIKRGGREVMYGNMLVKYSAFVETVL